MTRWKIQILVGGVVWALAGMSPAIAAETMLFKMGPWRERLAVQDLITYRQTGELPAPFDGLLKSSPFLARLSRLALNEPLHLDVVKLDSFLNSPLGETLLDRLGEVIHTPAGQADRQALRSALVLSASDDQQVTLLEVLQKYPTPEVQLEGDRLLQAYNQLNDLAKDLPDWVLPLPSPLVQPAL